MKRTGSMKTARIMVGALLMLPLAVQAQSYTRIETIEYHDNTASWVLGQTAKVTCVAPAACIAASSPTGIVISETFYDALARPVAAKSYGRLTQTLTYNADGTVATVKDGNNNVTTLSSWKRGIPQSIQFPGTPEAPSGTTQSAFVNDHGWIEWVEDENGFRTNYTHDAMGRLASIVYPTGDSTTWNTTTQVFQPVSSAEYGIPAGHWRQTISTGNARKVVYFDALWRPLVTREYDAANEAGTQRFQRFAYDHEGRTTFASYPATVHNPTTGTWTEYDALGRPTSVSQDSELTPSLLTTTTEYLTGFQTRVTNPNLHQTTTDYLAWDQPTTDFPVQVTHPAGAHTHITRDVFGKPTVLRRSDSASPTGGMVAVDRAYTYNVHQELCRSVEPETGATLMGYDGAGNLKWSAAGLPSGQACEAHGTTPTVAARRVDRTYDGRNWLRTLGFPDGRGNQAWAYTLDGLPASITTYNATGSGEPVVNAYSYNKRRMLVGESVTQPGWYSWGVGYGYDANGHLAVQTYPTGLAIGYAPNALGQATEARDQYGVAYAGNASYHPNGALKQFTYGNGIVHTMVQNARQLPGRVTSGGSVSDLAYYYDGNGNVNHIWDHARDSGNGFYGRWMAYDGLDRLTDVGSCSFGGDCWHRFTYDALDNIRSWKLGGVKDYAEYVYDASSRLTNIRNSAGSSIVGLGYDEQGNLANKNGQGYGFDYGNRLREVSGKEYYRYDGHGRRVLAWNPRSNSILSIYSQAGQLLYQEDHRKAVASENIYFAGSVLAIRDRPFSSGTPETKYQHTDALGSPVAVSNAAGSVIDRTDWEPYGAAINKSTYQGVGYTGHVQDGLTGLTYMQQRYFDPQIGRFLSVDPVTANSATGANFNRYWYGNNNPYRFTDPDGRQPFPTPQNFNVDMSKRVPNEVSNAWKTAEQAAAPKAVYASGTAGEAAGGGFVGGKGQVASGTVAVGVKGLSGNVSGPGAVMSTPAGSVQLQASSKGIEANTLNATVVGAHAGPVGYEVGISSLTIAKAIDNLDTKTTVSLPGISVSWGSNKNDAGWAIGTSIAKPSAALSFVRTDKPADP